MSNVYIYVVGPQDRKSRGAEAAQMLPPPPCSHLSTSYDSLTERT